MRRYLLTLLLILAAAPAEAAIAHVQTVSCSAIGVQTCTTGTITSTTGSLFVLSSAHYTDGVNSALSDSKLNVYTLATSELSTTNLTQVRIDYKANGTGGASHSFTWTSSDSFYGVLSASEISGATTTPLDKTIGAIDTTSPHSSTATAATTQAAELLLGMGTNFVGVAPVNDGGAGWVERTNIPGNGSDTIGLITGTRVVAATSTYAYTWTTGSSADSASHITTWKELAAATKLFRNEGDLTGGGVGGPFFKGPLQ